MNSNKSPWKPVPGMSGMESKPVESPDRANPVVRQVVDALRERFKEIDEQVEAERSRQRRVYPVAYAHCPEIPMPKHRSALIGSYLFDDRSKCSDILRIEDVLFEDAEVALVVCRLESRGPEVADPSKDYPLEKILVNKASGTVVGQAYVHWLLNC